MKNELDIKKSKRTWNRRKTQEKVYFYEVCAYCVLFVSLVIFQNGADNEYQYLLHVSFHA